MLFEDSLRIKALQRMRMFISVLLYISISRFTSIMEYTYMVLGTLKQRNVGRLPTLAILTTLYSKVVLCQRFCIKFD